MGKFSPEGGQAVRLARSISEHQPPTPVGGGGQPTQTRVFLFLHPNMPARSPRRLIWNLKATCSILGLLPPWRWRGGGCLYTEGFFTPLPPKASVLAARARSPPPPHLMGSCSQSGLEKPWRTLYNPLCGTSQGWQCCQHCSRCFWKGPAPQTVGCHMPLPSALPLDPALSVLCFFQCSRPSSSQSLTPGLTSWGRCTID